VNKLSRNTSDYFCFGVMNSGSQTLLNGGGLLLTRPVSMCTDGNNYNYDGIITPSGTQGNSNINKIYQLTY
jgi:hypothetical protein